MGVIRQFTYPDPSRPIQISGRDALLLGVKGVDTSLLLETRVKYPTYPSLSTPILYIPCTMSWIGDYARVIHNRH